MVSDSAVIHGGPIFDGQHLRHGLFARIDAGRLTALGTASDRPTDIPAIDLDGDILSPGYVDCQVNGGGGAMVGDAPSLATLERIAQAHRGLGMVRFLPTLISATPEISRATIAAAREAVEAGVRGVSGLHLEGPHLAVARKGAHDAALLRPMTEADCQDLVEAATALPCLMLTVAPEAVSVAQVQRLSAAGAIVSLGHTDADFATSMAYFEAGARMATHLFNAMSPLHHRAPGLPGAALAHGAAFAGLIADGVHVHPEVMRIAWQAKRGPGEICLVSDAMAVAGTDLTSFTLDGRRISRENGQLRLPDGTLAGADLDLTRAIKTVVEQAGVPLEAALRAVTSAPARLCGLTGYGLEPGKTEARDLIRIRADLSGLVPLDQSASGGSS